MLKSTRFVCGLLLAGLLVSCSSPEQTQSSSQTLGLFKNDPQADQGVVLLAPSLTKNVYLMDSQGRELHSWKTHYYGTSAYLLPNGNLLRCGVVNPILRKFGNHGALARIEMHSWEGKSLWHYEPSEDKYQLHHDIAPMPNGNILAIAWERLTPKEIRAAGRDPALVKQEDKGELWPEAIFEIQPDYQTGSGGKIVWEWHAKDHLVQDRYPDKANYYGEKGVIEHPELIDLNYVSREGAANLSEGDWLHFNSVFYDPQTDQIILSSREFSEIWVIDHSTTTAQAAGHTGGKSGKGGDLVYRYGNPETHRLAGPEARELYYQHDSQIIPPGYPGAGNIIVYNNGAARPDGHYSSIKEIKPTWGQYSQGEIVWSYQSDPKTDFYSPIVSSAQRLSNGNTLINQGSIGRYFEVNRAGEIVWEYISPVTESGILKQGSIVPLFPKLPIPGVYSNLTFHVRKYPVDYSAFEGKSLEPVSFLVTVD